MIKLAFVHSVAKIGGAERVSQMLMSGLSQSQFKCYLACPEQGALSEWAREQSIPFYELPFEQPGLSNLFSSIQQFIKWRSFFKAQQINIVHTADPYCTRVIALAAKSCGVKVLSHFHFPFDEKHLAWLMRRQPKPDVCVFCSEDLAREVGAYIQKIDSSVQQVTIHNGVDTSRFIPADLPAQAPLHVGIVANLQKRKGHDDFLDMAALLKHAGEDLQFDIIGGDILEEPRESYLKDKASTLGLQDIIVFHGQVADVLSRLASLDIVVCASHQEAFPIAILEAMAMQKAIVTTNVNGIPEAIVDGESGLLVSPHSPEELACAVSRLIHDATLRQNLAHNARSRVEQQFDVSIFVARFSELYQELACRK